ncbi:MAG: YcxB family protein [Chitinophagaceae bacterium]|nr:MAG: YcxB family protein [Chitinophagaceae bacterium]
MTIYFEYDKSQVIQALRYHFISKAEIRIMIILVNVFAILSIVLYALKKIGPGPFLVGATLWIVLMISFWFLLPYIVYRRAVTFKHAFSMHFRENNFELEHEHGSRPWAYTALAYYLESPHFFHLYFDSRSFLLVPKNAKMGASDVSDLRKILSENVKKK